MSIRTLIAEDEKPARDRLSLALKAIADITLVGEAVNGAQAAEMIDRLKPELVFLDVQMPVLNGFEVLEHCKARPKVIFTTAYDEYALRAFEVHAIDYLLKPYGKERLRAAVEHAIERLARSAADGERDKIPRLLSDYRKAHPYLARMSIKQGRSFKIAPIEQVEYFSADGGLVFWVEGGKRFMIDATLKELETKLDPARFLRLRRGVVANLSKIARALPLGHGRLAAEFLGGDRIEVGRTHLDDFRRALRLGR